MNEQQGETVLEREVSAFEKILLVEVRLCLHLCPKVLST
jgi:hypothetical protein